jgi:hypothetical protein
LGDDGSGEDEEEVEDEVEEEEEEVEDEDEEEEVIEEEEDEKEEEEGARTEQSIEGITLLPSEDSKSADPFLFRAPLELCPGVCVSPRDMEL